MTKNFTEPLLVSDDNEYVMFPIKDQVVWGMYKKQIDLFWRVEEVDLSKDMDDWTSLTGNEKHFVSMILAFFAASDGIVIENLATRFTQDVAWSEVKAFYGFQIAMENIHSEMYSVLISTYITNPLEQTKLFNAMDEFPCIKKKADWSIKWNKRQAEQFCDPSCGIRLHRRHFLLRCLLQYFLAEKTRTTTWSRTKQ